MGGEGHLTITTAGENRGVYCYSGGNYSLPLLSGARKSHGLGRRELSRTAPVRRPRPPSRDISWSFAYGFRRRESTKRRRFSVPSDLSRPNRPGVPNTTTRPRNPTCRRENRYERSVKGGRGESVAQRRVLFRVRPPPQPPYPPTPLPGTIFHNYRRG